MANTVNVNVNVNSNINKTTDQAETLAKLLKEAAAAASKIRIPTMVAAAEQAASASAGSANQTGKQSQLGRSISGSTGSATRDFARQAEGLGGLVRLYATFAANIFAVTAAFGALSKAADTANLIKGLDQLGAASGKNLGAAAKDLVRATDGALSLADAMKATANASAAGLSAQKIRELGAVAKSASQTLGVNMPDAISRLTRGITKLEPELLDEIGIFTRVDKAVNDYARSVGKSVSSLTDFERRQAFANAALAEGAAKFGAIQLESNPYTKLAASLQDVLFKGLDVINTVLGPIAKLLAESPTALGLAIAYIAKTLINQALPAIGQWREGLLKSAQAANEAVIATNKLRRETKIAFDSAEGIKLGQKQAESIKRMTAAYREYQAATQSKAVLKATQSLVPAFGVEATEDQIKALEKRADALVKQIGDPTLSQKVIDRRKEELRIVKNLTREYKNTLSINKEMEKVDKSISDSLASRAARFFGEDASRNRIADAAVARAQRATALQNFSSNIDTKGMSLAWKEFTNEVSKARMAQDALGNSFESGIKKMSRFNATMTLAAGGVIALGSAFGTLVRSLGGILTAIAIITATVSILLSFIPRAEKESKKFSEALDGLNSSLDNIDKTLETITRKNPSEVFSVKSIEAQANAFNDLSESLSTTAASYEKLVRNRTGVDNVLESIFAFLGRGDEDKLKVTIADTYKKAIDLAGRDIEKSEEIKKLYRSVLNISNPSNLTAIQDAFTNLSNDKQVQVLKDLDRGMSAISLSSNNAASTVVEVASGVEELGKLVNDLNASLASTDIQGKLGEKLISESFKITKGLQDPINSLTVLQSIIKDTKTLSLLSPTTASELNKVSSEINKLNEEMGNTFKLRKDLESKVESVSGSDAEAVARRTSLVQQLMLAKTEEVNLQIRANEFVQRFKNLGDEIFEQGVKKLEVSLKGVFAQASIDIAKNRASVLKSLGADTANLEAKLGQEELNVQRSLINAMYASTEATVKLTLEQRKASLLLERQSIKSDLGTGSRLEQQQTKLLQIDKQLLNVEEAIKLATNGNSSKLRSIMTSKDPELREIAVELSDLFVKSIQKEAALAGINAKSAIIEFNRRVQVVEERFKNISKDTATTGDKAGEELSGIKSQKELAGIYVEQLDTREALLESIILANEYQLKQLEYSKMIAQLELFGAKNVEARNRIDKISLEQTQLYNRYIVDQQVLFERNAEKRIKAEEDINNKKREAVKLEAEINAKSLTSRIDLLNAEINARQNLGTISEAELVRLNSVSNKQQLQVKYAQDLLELEDKRNNETFALQQILKSGLLNSEATKAVENEIARINKLYGAQNNSLQSIFQNNLKIVDINKQTEISLIAINKQYKDQEDNLNKLQMFAESLGSVFDKFGESLGNVLIGIQTIADRETNYFKEREKIKEKFKARPEDDIDDVRAKQVQELEELNKLEKKSAREQIGDFAKVAGAAKTMFSERTKAAKLFGAIEKGLHIVRIADMVKEHALNLVNTAKSVAAAFTRASADGISAIVKALASVPFPANIAAAAATAAVVRNLLGSGPGVTAGASAEQRQETQGTGQEYKDGKIVNRSGGVFGDATAKSEDIIKSLELTQRHTFKQLEYSNESTIALKEIVKNTEGLAGLLARVTGVGAENIFSGVEGTSLNAIAGLFGDGLLGNLLGSIFGKTKKEIIDSGVAFQGSLKDIIDGTIELQAYATVQTTKKNLFSSKTSIDELVSEFPDSINTGIQQFFRNIVQSTLNAVNSLSDNLDPGIGSKISGAISDSIANIKISTKDLSGSEIAEAIQAELGIIINSAIEATAPYLKEFQLLGEGLLTTLTRLSSNRSIVDKALESIGRGFKVSGSLEPSIEQTIRLYEGLIEGVGGIDEFVSKIEFFSENFLTEAQRLVPVQQAVTNEMKRLGFESIKTKDQFRQLIQGIDLTRPSMNILFQDLLNVSEAFYMVAEAAEVFNSKVQEKQLELLKLTGQVTEAVSIERAKEIENIRKLGDEQAATLIPIQQAIWQKQDELAIIKLQISLLQAQGKAYDALTVRREQELAALTDNEKAIQKLIYLEEDRQKGFDLETEALNAAGFSHEALLRTRLKEIEGLSQSDKQLRWFIHAIQDYIKTEQLEIELLEAKGESVEALNKRRSIELKGLSLTDQALKIRIWRLQDEKKLLDQKNSYDLRILELRGNKEQLLQKRRELELKTIDQMFVPFQMYVYALEDEVALKEELQEAYDKEKEAIKTNISALKDSIKALRDYRKEVLLGELSTLTPAQKYAEAKQQALQVAAIASGIATTESEKLAKQAAIDKLPEVTNKWLEASRTLYASSQEYTNDFNLALSILDATANALEAQETEAQKQLRVMEDSLKTLNAIKESTRSFAEISIDLKNAQIKSNEWLEQLTEHARTLNLSQGSGPTAEQPAYASVDYANQMITGRSGGSISFQQARDIVNANFAINSRGLYDAVVREGITSKMVDAIMGYNPGTSLLWALQQGFPAFADGGVASGLSIVGEEGPELVDFINPGRVYPADQTSAMLGNNRDLINEIKALRGEVAALRAQQREETGHIITTNYDANNRVAQKISSSIEQVSSNSEWKDRSKLKLA